MSASISPSTASSGQRSKFVPEVGTYPRQFEGLIDIGKLDHYTCIVPDSKAACQFYTEVLGFTLERVQPVNCGTAPEGEYDMLNYIVRHPLTSEVVVVITEGLTDNSIFTRLLNRYGAGIHHVAYVVDDLNKSFSTLLSAGVRFTSNEIHHDPLTGLRQVFISRELTGHFIELIERTEWSPNGLFRSNNMARLANSMEAYTKPDDSEANGDGDADSDGMEGGLSIIIDEPADLVREFIANPGNLPRWTCHKTVRLIDDRWIEIRQRGDVLVDGWIGNDEQTAYLRWRQGENSLTAAIAVEPLESKSCQVTIEMPEVPADRRERLQSIFKAELRLLAAQFPSADVLDDLSSEHALIERYHLEVYQRHGL